MRCRAQISAVSGQWLSGVILWHDTESATAQVMQLQAAYLAKAHCSDG